MFSSTSKQIINTSIAVFLLTLSFWKLGNFNVIYVCILLFLLIIYIIIYSPKIFNSDKNNFILVVFGILNCYWFLNIILIANLPFSTYLSLSFWKDDGKFFLAYLPFILPFLISSISTIDQEKIGKFIKYITIPGFILIILSLIQIVFSFKIPLLRSRQQLVLFEGGNREIFIGGLLSQNAAGILCVFFSLYAFYKMLMSKKKAFYGLLFVLSNLAIFFTYSRSTFLSFVFSFAFFVSLFVYKKYKDRIKKLILPALILFTIVLIGTGYYIYKETISWNKKLDNVQSRVYLWEKALYDTYQAPLFGIGLTRFNDNNLVIKKLPFGLAVTESGSVVINEAHAHNYYLHLMAETGIIGLCLFLLWWLSIIGLSFENFIKSDSIEKASWHLLLFSSFLALSISNLFENNFPAPSVMFLYSFLAGLNIIKNPLSRAREEQNILFMNHRSALGGGEKVLLEFWRNTKIDHNNMHFLAFEKGSLVNEAKKLGIKATIISNQDEIVNISRAKGKVTDLCKGIVGIIHSIVVTVLTIKKYRIDIIYSNSIKADVIAGIAGRIAEKKVVVRLHDILESSEFNPLSRHILIFVFKHFVDQIIAVSIAVKQALINLGVSEKKISVVYNGLKIPANSTEKISWEKFRISKDDILFANIGRIIRHKGQDLCIDTWEEIIKDFPQAKLLIIGKGLFDYDDYEKELRQKVKEKKLTNNIFFTGYFSNIFPVIDSIDVVLNTSTSPDSLPTNLIEAILMKKFVIASRTGGVGEIVYNNSYGWLYEDPKKLKELIVKYINNPIKISDNRDFASKFSVDTYISKIEEIIKH